MLQKRNRLPSRVKLVRPTVTRTNAFILTYSPNQTQTSRFRCTIAKKTIAKAVSRNQLKRKWSRCISASLENFKKGYDIIFLMRPAAAKIQDQALCTLIDQSLQIIEKTF